MRSLIVSFRTKAKKKLYDPPEPDGDWYLHLSERLNSSFDEFEQNKLSIVTFNYDRSLEHYLFTSLLNWHGRSVDACIEKFAKLPIIHVYGQLGKIPYPQQDCRQYLPFDEDQKKVPGAVVNASRGITLLHEEESELREVHDLLTAAERVCFLGFGYNPLNLARLQLKGDTVIEREVFGTARHFEKSEFGQTERHLSSTLLCGRVTLDDADNLTVLRRHLILGL